MSAEEQKKKLDDLVASVNTLANKLNEFLGGTDLTKLIDEVSKAEENTSQTNISNIINSITQQNENISNVYSENISRVSTNITRTTNPAPKITIKQEQKEIEISPAAVEQINYLLDLLAQSLTFAVSASELVTNTDELYRWSVSVKNTTDAYVDLLTIRFIKLGTAEVSE
jgi:uncharacterized FlaG/YvyC family protein